MRTPSSPDAERVRRAADRLHSTAIRLLRRVRATDVESGISPARLSVLSLLVFAGEKTVGELAEIEQVRAPTMTGLVAGLVDDRLVTRRADRTDRRVVRVRVTAAGRRLLEAARRRRVTELARLLAGASEAELAAIETAVDLLQTRLVAPSADGR